MRYNNPFTATINGILDLFKKQTPIGELGANDRLDGKTCLVTGANSGLGFAVATQLVQRGAFVVMACRGGIPEAGEKVTKITRSNLLKMIPIDLSKIDSIHQFIQTIKSEGWQFDVAVFNAAMVPSGSQKMASGFDQMFLVNYLSKFILVNGLLEINAIPKRKTNHARIIFVSSESHRSTSAIDFEKLGVFEEYKMGKVIALYGDYKLLLNTYATELSRRLNNKHLNINVFALCPGPINSNIARAAPKAVVPILKLVFKLFFRSPTKAAEPVLYLACSPAIKKRSSLYLHFMQEKAMDEKALDPENGKKLWEKSVELVKGRS